MPKRKEPFYIQLLGLALPGMWNHEEPFRKGWCHMPSALSGFQRDSCSRPKLGTAPRDARTPPPAWAGSWTRRARPLLSPQSGSSSGPRHEAGSSGPHAEPRRSRGPWGPPARSAHKVQLEHCLTQSQKKHWKDKAMRDLGQNSKTKAISFYNSIINFLGNGSAEGQMKCLETGRWSKKEYN